MAIKFEKTKIQGGVPVFWRGECKTLPGDFALTNPPADGEIVRKSTPIKVDFDNMQATICKVVKIVSGGTTSAPRVQKGSAVVVGDELTIGENSKEITAIDKSNADYDVLTLEAALTGATNGAEAVVGDDVPNMVVESDKEMTSKAGFNTVSAGYDVVILKATAVPVATAWLDDGGLFLKGNPSIKYIRQ